MGHFGVIVFQTVLAVQMNSHVTVSTNEQSCDSKYK